MCVTGAPLDRQAVDMPLSVCLARSSARFFGISALGPCLPRRPLCHRQWLYQRRPPAEFSPKARLLRQGIGRLGLGTSRRMRQPRASGFVHRDQQRRFAHLRQRLAKQWRPHQAKVRSPFLLQLRGRPLQLTPPLPEPLPEQGRGACKGHSSGTLT